MFGPFTGVPSSNILAQPDVTRQLTSNGLLKPLLNNFLLSIDSEHNFEYNIKNLVLETYILDLLKYGYNNSIFDKILYIPVVKTAGATGKMPL